VAVLTPRTPKVTSPVWIPCRAGNAVLEKSYPTPWMTAPVTSHGTLVEPATPVPSNPRSTPRATHRPGEPCGPLEKSVSVEILVLPLTGGMR
jgi:hypothetical protein